MPELTDQKKQMIRVFHHEARRLLTDSERRMLFRVLKDYQRRRQVDQLVDGLSVILHSPEKLDLLQHIRDLIPRSHIVEFDNYFRQHAEKKSRVHQVHVHHARTPDRVNKLRVHRNPELEGRLSRFLPNNSPSSSRRSGYRPYRPNNNENLFDHSHGGDIQIITIQKEGQDKGLGFSVRGGSEHGLGMYVSEVEQGSTADVAGLEVGDKILEVNNISLVNVASSSAVNVLSGSARLKIMVERTGTVPEWRLSREKISWFDSHTKRLIVGDFEDAGADLFIRGLDVDIPERRVTLSCTKPKQPLGFNIRGGNEYGLGIYVSNVDKGSIAAKNGVRVGDQVIDVNGVPFDNISHPHAVEVLKSHTHLILTLRDVGRYPAFKELFAEYTWADKSVSGDSVSQRFSHLKQTKLQDLWLDKGTSHRNSSLMLRVPVQSGIYARPHVHSTELPLQAEIYLPTQQKGNNSRKSSRVGTIDNQSTISFENWSSRVEGTMNPAFLQSDSDDDTINSDTDVESGVHGEYTITMDHIIGSKVNNELNIINEEKVTKSDNNKKIYVDSKADDYDVLNTYSKVSRSHDEVDNNIDKLSEDDAVLTLSPMMDVSSDSNSQISDVSVKSSEHSLELTPLPYSEMQNDIDSISCNSAKYTTTETSKRSECYLLSNVSTVQDKEENSTGRDTPVYSTPLKVPRQKALQEMEEEKLSSGSNPYDINFEQDDDLMYVMKNFDQQLQDLEQRQSNIGFMEMSSLSSPEHSSSSSGYKETEKETTTQKKKSKKSKDENEKQTKWEFIRDKLKGTLRMKSAKDSGGSVSSKSSVFSRGMGGKGVLHQHTVDQHNMSVLKDAANKLLNMDENSAVIRHVNRYHESRDLDELVSRVMPLLDKPEKILLLRDIRGVLRPVDYTRFDQKVNRYEVDAYEKLSTKLHLQLNHVTKGMTPKRHLLMTEVDKKADETRQEDESGHFYIKPLEQHQKEQEIKQQIVDLMTGKGSYHDNTSEEEEEILSEECITTDDDADTQPQQQPQPQAIVVAFISKSKPLLGLCVSGGNDSRKQPEVKVDKVVPGGAAADEPNIKPGMVILSVDEVNLVGATHAEAVNTIKNSFKNKDIAMKLVMRRDS